VLSDPAAVSSPLALIGGLLLPSRFSTLSACGCRLTRLNRFTCVTACPSLCLRLAHVVTSMRPRLDSRWGGSFPCRRGNSTRWKRQAWPGAPKNLARSDRRQCGSRLDMSLYLPECSVSTALGSKAETRLGKLRIENRRHGLRDGLLDQPIDHSRYPQQSLAPPGLGCSPTHRLWTIAAIKEATAYRRPVLARIARKSSMRIPSMPGAPLWLSPDATRGACSPRHHLFHQINVQGRLRAATRASAPPVGFVVECESLTTPPCPFVSALRYVRLAASAASTASADFCPSRSPIARRRAVLLTPALPASRARGGSTPCAWTLVYQWPGWLPMTHFAPPRRTDLPNKNMSSRCTHRCIYPIRWSRWALSSGADSPRLSLLCSSCSSARTFALGFLQTNPRGLALAVG